MPNEFQYASLTQLGELFGVSSQKVGRWLVEVGLRTADKKPSPRAFGEKYCDQQPIGEGYFYVWDRQKTIAALEAAGHRRIDRLFGPFDVREGSKNEFEILDANGTVGITAGSQEYARFVAFLLNVAHKHGKLPNQAEKATP